MKRLFILTLAIVCLGVHQEIYAEIKNGYDNEIIKAQIRISNLNEIAQGAITTDQRIRLKKWLKTTHANVEKLRHNHAKTHELIEKFRIIDPGLYYEMNTIQDCEGNETDVYIKVVDDLGPDVLGVTNVSQSVENPNVYSSEYGDYTVSVRLIMTSPIRDLIVLVHELGHVRYQVPHLADYTALYKKIYQDTIIIGHHYDDPSHQSVKETLKTFNESWIKYNREGKKLTENKSRKTLASTEEY